MGNINNGGDMNIGRDFIFNDSSQQYKSLEVCSNDELYAERAHRKTQASKERRRKMKMIFALVCVAVVVGLGVAIWYYIAGAVSLAMFVLAALGVGMPLLGVYTSLKEPTEFENRQRHALRQIRMILRDRGAE